MGVKLTPETLTQPPCGSPILALVLGHLTYIAGLQDGGAGDGFIGTDLIWVIQLLECSILVRFQEFALGHRTEISMWNDYRGAWGLTTHP